MKQIIKALETILDISINDLKEIREKKDLAYATSLAKLLADELQAQFNEIETNKIIWSKE